MSQIKNNEFLRVAIEQVPRLLGQLNRNPGSRAYGSFDRAYWHYRTNDISSCRYQEAVYTLTLLYCYQFEGNNYYHDEKLLEWIRAALHFTVSIQHSNGSFDEWYINEGSYVGTAFLTAALSQTLLLLKENGILIPENNVICEVVERAAHFLSKHEEKTVMNQVSGAIFAIASAGYLSDRKEFLAFADRLLNEFISKQSKEGWWNEYGGPDVGYLSLTISYLEKYQKLTGSKKVTAPIFKAKSFIQKFINPDQTAGGEYMSRNTEYIIPSATLPYLGAVRPIHFDDRYLCYILYNWIEAGLETAPQPIKINPGENYFPESTLLRVVNKNYFLVANGKKGASFRLYSAGKVYFDSGLEIKGASTGLLDESDRVEFQSGRLESHGVFKKIKEPLLKTKIMILFKIHQLLFGRLSFLQKMVKKFLRLQMISYSNASTVDFKRMIEYNIHSVIVTDIVRGADSEDDIIFGMKAAYSAVPSSKFSAIPEIADRLLSPDFEEKEENGTYIIKRVFSFND